MSFSSGAAVRPERALGAQTLWERLARTLDTLFYIALTVAMIAALVAVYAVSTRRYSRTLGLQARRARRETRDMTQESRSFVRAMQAEDAVERVLREEGWEDVFLRRRVYVQRQGHNREIDVVAVGPVVLVVEVKNWQGYVWSNGPRWFQQPSPRNTLEFEDVQADNVIKAAALRRYIENARRVRLPDADAITTTSLFEDTSVEINEAGREVSRNKGTWYTDQSLHKQCGTTVLPIVVFTNPRVKLDPATVKAKKYIFTLRTLRHFAREALKGNIDTITEVPAAPPSASDDGSEGLVARLVQRPARLLYAMLGGGGVPRNLVSSLGTPLLDKETRGKVAYGIDVMRTWDTIYLHDGTLLNGDVQRVDAPTAHCAYERKHLLEMHVRWHTGIRGAIASLLYNKPGTVELVLVAEKRYAKKKSENKPRNAEGNIVFPIAVERTARNKNIYDRLTIKEAGKLHIQEVRIVDIKSIHLSRHLYEAEQHLL